MGHNTETRSGEEYGPAGHLEQALECSEPQMKNFHIRQALQLLIARSESQ